MEDGLMEISFTILKAMLREAAEIGAKKALTESGHIKPYISKRKAHDMYGRRNVERWISEGLIIPIKDGDENCSIRIDRIEIEAVAKASNRVSFFTNKPRR